MIVGTHFYQQALRKHCERIVMKKLYTSMSGILCGLFLVAVAHSQQPTIDKVTVPLTDPARPMFLKIGLISGGITVKAYAGKEVLVEASTHPDDNDEDSEEATKRKGLKRIPNTSTGLTIEEDDNTVFVSNSGRWGSRQIDLNIQVPPNCSMKLSTINEGDIVVSGVKGDLDINNTNGSVTLKDISGSVVANALNGEILVTMSGVNPEKSMSFSSMNGTIDVTFPSTIKATLQIRNDQGEVYSDFDMQVERSKPVVEESRKDKGGKFKVSMDKGMKATVNGGGQDIQFKNFNGNIYVRKGK